MGGRPGGLLLVTAVVAVVALLALCCPLAHARPDARRPTYSLGNLLKDVMEEGNAAVVGTTPKRKAAAKAPAASTNSKRGSAAAPIVYDVEALDDAEEAEDEAADEEDAATTYAADDSDADGVAMMDDDDDAGDGATDDSTQARLQAMSSQGSSVSTTDANSEVSSADYDSICPSPQSADSVSNRYLGHGAFTWRVLAANTVLDHGLCSGPTPRHHRNGQQQQQQRGEGPPHGRPGHGLTPHGGPDGHRHTGGPAHTLEQQLHGRPPMLAQAQHQQGHAAGMQDSKAAAAQPLNNMMSMQKQPAQPQVQARLQSGPSAAEPPTQRVVPQVDGQQPWRAYQARLQQAAEPSAWPADEGSHGRPEAHVQAHEPDFELEGQRPQASLALEMHAMEMQHHQAQAQAGSMGWQRFQGSHIQTHPEGKEPQQEQQQKQEQERPQEQQQQEQVKPAEQPQAPKPDVATASTDRPGPLRAQLNERGMASNVSSASAGGGAVSTAALTASPNKATRPASAAAGGAVTTAALTKAPNTAPKHGAAAQAAAAAAKAAAAKSKAAVAAMPASYADPEALVDTSRGEAATGFEGTFDSRQPTDQALAVGPHPTDPDTVIALHGVNGALELFVVTKEDGQAVPSVTPTKICLSSIMATTGLEFAGLSETDPVAWYDRKAARYVVAWSTYADGSAPPTRDAPLFLMASRTNNPFDSWSVWVLDAVPEVAPGLRFCEGQPRGSFQPANLQASYGRDAIFLTTGSYCKTPQGASQFLSSLWVYHKAALFAAPPRGGYDGDSPPAPLYGANYLAPTAWYRSIARAAQALVGDASKPFNNYIQAARPQAAADVAAAPLFVMKVDDAMLSIATLTDDLPLSKMINVETAPSLLATLAGKGADFGSSSKPYGDGDEAEQAVMPQPGSTPLLSAGDVGMMGRTFNVRTYGAIQHKGMLYVTASEWYGDEDAHRLPAIWWGMFEPAAGMCRAHRHDWGVIASSSSLALAFPSIAARKQGGAVVAYSYSGSSEILTREGPVPAYAGVATTIVGTGEQAGTDVVKHGWGPLGYTPGDGPYSHQPLPWGDYSAVEVCGDQMFFAVPLSVARGGEADYGSWIGVIGLGEQTHEYGQAAAAAEAATAAQQA